jgi:hypothetical protein
MLSRLAGFLYAHGRRVLFVAVLGAVVAGAFGFGVAKHLSPYGASDPATQSVQAMNRYEPGSRSIPAWWHWSTPGARARPPRASGC